LQNDANRLNSELQDKHRRAQQAFADRLARVQVHSGAYPPISEATITDLADRLPFLLAPKEDYQETMAQLVEW
jgi:hypothetical protein